MQSLNTLTIRELPKTKKMAVDEMHPVMKMQKNVSFSPCSGSLWMKRKGWTMSLRHTAAPWRWWFVTRDKSWLSPRECPDSGLPSFVFFWWCSPGKQLEPFKQVGVWGRVQPRCHRSGAQCTWALHEAVQLISCGLIRIIIAYSNLYSFDRKALKQFIKFLKERSLEYCYRSCHYNQCLYSSKLFTPFSKSNW